MRPAILICLFLISGYIAQAQFTFLPQIGFERARTSLQVNDQSTFTPLRPNLMPQASIRLDYRTKQGHGPFLGVATSRSIVDYKFSNSQAGINSTGSKGNIQLRLEGGYQVSTKPIYFKKSGSGNKLAQVNNLKNTGKKSCGSYSARSSSCGSKMSKPSAATSAARGSWVRIQPSLGVAYVPFSPSTEIETKSMANQTIYAYNAGNWNTAIISGVGFEFGKNDQKKVVFSVNYLKGMGNLDSKSVTMLTGNKPNTVSLKSNASAWSIRMGIPVNFNKKKTVPVKQPVIEKIYKEKYKCGQYQYKQCRKVI